MLLHERVRGYLEEYIENGKPGEQLPSEYTLCRRFGVSRVTVRQALRQIERTGRVVRRQGKGTFIARIPGKREISSHTIKILFPVWDRPEDSFLFPILQSLIKRLGNQTYRVTLTPFAPAEISMSRLSGVDALFWIAPYAGEIQYLNAVRQQGIPVLVVNRVLPLHGVSYVSCDHYAGGVTAGELFLSRGHKEVGFLGFFEGNPCIIQRLDGLRTALSRKRLNLPDERILKVEMPFKQKQIDADVKRLLKDKGLTAGLISSGSLFPMYLKALLKSGVVPGDGFDIVVFDEWPEVQEDVEDAIFRMVQPLEEIGERAASEMLRLMVGEVDVVQVKLPPLLRQPALIS